MTSDELASIWMNAAETLRAEGRLEGRRETLLELLDIKFGPVDPAVRTRIEEAPFHLLTFWMRRVVIVPTLGRVFGS
jgi:hypothetical protein